MGSPFKLGSAEVGAVSKIETKNYLAYATIKIDHRRDIPKDSTFEVRFLTPLGENYIVATPPAGVSTASAMPSGSVVSIADTANAPSIEDTFAALSTLLNGGGLSQLHTIATELDNALTGRGGTVRGTLASVQKVIGTLNASRGEIGSALDSLDRLAQRVESSNEIVTDALNQFPAAAQAIRTDIKLLRPLVQKVAGLNATVSGLLNRSQDQFLHDLDQLRPTLQALGDVAGQLPSTIDAVTQLGSLAQHATPGNYALGSLFLTLTFGIKPTPLKGSHLGEVGTGAPRRQDARSSSNSSLEQLLAGGQS